MRPKRSPDPDRLVLLGGPPAIGLDHLPGLLLAQVAVAILIVRLFGGACPSVALLRSPPKCSPAEALEMARLLRLAVREARKNRAAERSAVPGNGKAQARKED